LPTTPTTTNTARTRIHHGYTVKSTPLLGRQKSPHLARGALGP
jgi:hypothetical protein